MSELVRFLSGDNDVAQKTQMDPQNPTAKFVPLEPGQVLFGLEVVEDGSLLGTIYYDYKDKNGIITRVSMGNGGAGGSGGGGGIIKTLATTDGKHESDEVTATANTIIPLPKKIFANLLSAKTQFNFPKVHDPSNAAYVNEDAAPGQSYLYGNGLHMVNPFNTLQDSWIRTIGKSGSAEATLELAMRDNASNEYIYDQIVARHYKADGTIVTDTDGHKREVVILGKEGESQFPGPVTSQRGFVGDVDGNAKSATKAKQDWYDQVIDSTYLSKIVKTTHNGSKFVITSYDGRYTPVGSADAKKDVITIPGATTTLAGLVTTGDQTITGNKTIDSSGTLTIAKQGGFIYSGIQEDKATDKNLPLWFSTSTANGTPNYSTELTYNPSTGTVTAKKFAGPATSATYDAEGGAIHDKYLKRAGGTMTGALNFADNTYNAFGDDVEIGSQNAKGKLNIHGKNGATGIVFVPYSGTTSQTISIDGKGVMTITGSLKTTLDGNASTATTLKTARNFNITDSSAAYSGPSVSFNGSADVTLHMPDTFAGALKGNADTATKLATARTLWGQSFNGTANVSGNMTSVGNVTSTKTNTYTLGTSSNVWKAVYATTFYGALSGNADTATKLQTARSFHITDSSATYNGVSATFDGSADITLHMPDIFAGTLKGNADSATKLKTARTLWGQSFNGSANVTGAMSNVGNITSLKTNTHDIGSSSNVWKNIYATTFHGALDGKATSAGSADMANQVTHVLTIEGQSYDGSTDVAVGNTVFYIMGNSTDTTAGTWTGTDSKIKSYYNGLTIIYVPKVDGASTTTLNLNGLGAKTCYYSNTSKLTTHFAKGTPILLTYIDGYWRRADYDSNTNTQLRVYRQKTSDSAYNKEYPLLVSRTQASGIGTANSDGSYTSIYGVMNNDTAKIPTLNVHTGAITATSFKGTASNAINDVNGAKIDETYLKKSGGTMTGALNFANNTYNKFGDDVEVGDRNTSGKLYIHGLNGATGIIFAPYSGSTSQTLSIDGAGVMTITGTLKATLNGNASTATTLKTARNFHITDSSATYNGPNASFNGSADITLHMPSTFAGTLKGNADTATNADKLDGYHANAVYKAATHAINNYSSTNDWLRVATITISGSSLSMGGFTAIFSNRECLDSSSFILTVAIRRNSATAASCQAYVTPIGTSAPREILVRSNDGVNFYVYFKSALNSWTTYYNVTKIMSENNVTFENVGLPASNLIAGSVLNVTASRGGYVYRAQNADAATTATKWATARNFQVDLALDNPATVKVDGTKDVILPVTGILATKHGGTGNNSHTANRLVWSETATKLSATNNHYASATQIAINSTAAPTGYNFLVSGKTHLNGDARVTGNLLMTTGGSFILWDDGTYHQRILTTDDATTDTAVFTFQQSENTASSWNNLLTIRDNGRIVLQNEKGGIYKLVTTANTSPLIQLVSDDQNVSIFKVASGTSIIDSWSCGFDLKYIGTGAGVNNLLTLYAGDYHNTGTQVVGWSVNQAGQMGIRTTPNASYSLNINGNTYSNGKFYINNTTDASLSADGVVTIGPTSGENLTLDTNEIMARNNKAASTLYLNNEGGLVQIGSGGLLVNGQMKTTGPLLIGSDANGRSKNYIAFYGITGDGPDTWNHTFIGENLFGDTDKSELILFKGNDPGSTPEDMRYASGPGPDRIRHIAAGHLFQIYRTTLSGTFATIAQSTVPISIFEVNQQGVVVYNEGTDANNYPAKITFRVKDTINGTTSTATIAAYSDHGTASYGSNLVISSGGNTLIQAGDGTYGSYANLIGAGVNQGENLYLTADSSIQLCAAADTANRKLIWDGTTFYPSISNTFHLGSKSYRWASAHVYRDFNIYGTGSTSDESHVRFNANDNTQRAIIAFNGNTTNTLDATTHLKIATNYGDIRLDAASNYINVKGHILPRADFTATNYNIGSTTRRWGNVYANALRLQGPSSDPSEAQGARIEFAYDNGTNRSQPVYISYTPNDGYRAPYGLKIFGTETGNYGAWLEVQGAIGTSNTNASSGIGISLYGGPVNGKPAYGMFFGGTATFGKLYNTTSSTYGVSSDWATYFTMSDTTNRGWLFMRGATNVAGITGNGTFLSRISTGTHIAGNKGNVIIDGTAGAGYNMLFRQKSTKGVFTGGAWNTAWHIFYTADTTISAGTNGTTYGIRLINEAGNTQLNRLGINGENTSYQFYVNGTSLFGSTLTANGQIVSKVAAGTPPFSITSNTVSANLNADLLDGWHKQDVLGTYCVQSATASLSHYWCKIWSATIKNQQYNDIGITIYVQSQYNSKYGMFTWRLRQNGANNGGAYSFTTALQEHYGNISASDIRLYYDNATGACSVWVNCWGQYGAWNYSVLKKCYRTAQDSTAIGTFYNTNFTTAQTLPTSSYITASYTPFLGNAATATALTTSAGNAGQPVYFSSGKPVAIDWRIGNSGVGEHNANNVTYNFCGYYTSNGPATSLGASTNDGALYAQAYNSTWVGQIAQDYRNGGLYVRGKNNGTWQSWYKVLDTRNYTGVLDGRYVLKTGTAPTNLNSATTSGFYRVNSGHSNSPGDWGQLIVCHGGGDTITQIYGDYASGTLYTRSGNPSNVGGSGGWGSWRRVWLQGDAVTGAVWNDYAECRQAETEEAGYVLYETGHDDLKKTTERLQHFAGVSSDTWGFSQGETEKAKTPIAVAGRVLVYPYQDRNNYQPGDCVCAAPGGTVDIMTREEVVQYPDRIVGTVSCVPDYEEWGGGELADRDPVKVNGRIWIKVR